MTVYVAVEKWSNCEEYEDKSDSIEIVGVFSSMNIAKKAIDKIIADRIRLVKKKDPNITIVTFPNEYSVIRPGLYHAVCFDYQSAGTFSGPFATYVFGTDYFEYAIEELEIDSSKNMYNLNGGVDASKD